MTNDPSELLKLIGDFDGARDATMAPGVVSVIAFAIGMAPPLKTGHLNMDRAATRAYHAARFSTFNDTADGIAAWEAAAAQLPQMQAEARELWYRDHPEQRPEEESVREAPPAEGWTQADAVYRRDLRRK